MPLDSKNLSIIFKQEIPEAINTSSELVQFEPNMRFAKSNLSYYFYDECDSERVVSTERAFQILSEETQVLSFYRTNSFSSQPDITIKCSEKSKETESEDPNVRTFIAGEGGPKKYLELTPYPLIIQGEIQLYTSKYATKCSEPLVEIHELLHVFGYAHINDKTSIFYPYLSCNQELKPNIIQDIRRLYSEPAKAELSIANISASKAGKYLDFYIEIKNTGLINAEGVYIEISSENKIIHSEKLESLSPAMVQSLGMKNLQLPSSRTTSIRFVVKTSTPEYFSQDNLVEMVVG